MPPECLLIGYEKIIRLIDFPILFTWFRFCCGCQSKIVFLLQGVSISLSKRLVITIINGLIVENDQRKTKTKNVNFIITI